MPEIPIQNGDEEKVPPAVFFLTSPQVVIYGGGVVASVVGILHALGFRFLKDWEDMKTFGLSVATLGSCGYALYRRYKRGIDPTDSAPKLSLKKEK